jgi:hypothetical protein
MLLFVWEKQKKIIVRKHTVLDAKLEGVDRECTWMGAKKKSFLRKILTET